MKKVEKYTKIFFKSCLNLLFYLFLKFYFYIQNGIVSNVPLKIILINW